MVGEIVCLLSMHDFTGEMAFLLGLEGKHHLNSKYRKLFLVIVPEIGRPVYSICEFYYILNLA